MTALKYRNVYKSEEMYHQSTLTMSKKLVCTSNCFKHIIGP